MEATLYFFLSENSPKNVEAHCGLLSRVEVLWAHDLWSCLPMASVPCNVDLPSFLTPVPLLPGWGPQFVLCWKFSLGKWKQSLWCSKISARSDRCIPNTSLGLGYPRSLWVLECVVCCHKSPSESSFFFLNVYKQLQGSLADLGFSSSHTFCVSVSELTVYLPLLSAEIQLQLKPAPLCHAGGELPLVFFQ